MSANPYDPVMTKETDTFGAEDEWGLSLPAFKPEKYKRSSRLKSVCNKARQRPRCVVIVFSAVCVLILLCIIIAVAANKDHSRHPSGSGKWQSPKTGLVFYPEPSDHSTNIAFSDMDQDDIAAMRSSIYTVAKEYESIKQVGDNFFQCDHTVHPYNKTCRMYTSQFGHMCTKQRDYSYSHGMPCVFIQLNLPEGTTIEPIEESSPLWTAAKYVMAKHNDSSSVPLLCQGKTSEDIALIGTKGVDGASIQYFPADGFPSYFYRPRDPALPFLKPAVMVYITSLLQHKAVTLECTAWGQLFDQKGAMLDHELLTTTFTLYLK